MKKIIVLLSVVMCMVCLVGCNQESENSSEEAKTLRIAYQYGVSHCPAVICKEKNFIEESYKKATGKEVKIEWVQMNSGADVNTGIASGEIQAGFLGVPVAVSGIVNNVGYKIFINESGVQQCFMTNKKEFNTLKDIIGTSEQIALVNIGSANHIALGMALVEEGLDAHSLDSNIVAMKYPDGLSSIVSGAIACHVATEPYLSQEKEDKNLHEIPSLNNAWKKEDSFNVGVASEDLYNSDKDLYNALVAGVTEAIEFINKDSESAAEIVAKYDGNDKSLDQKCLENSCFNVETKNLYKIATFMADSGFIDKKPESYEQLVYDNVKGN